MTEPFMSREAVRSSDAGTPSGRESAPEILDAEASNVSGYHSTAGPDTLGALPGLVRHLGAGPIPLTGGHVGRRAAGKDNQRLAFDEAGPHSLIVLRQLAPVFILAESPDRADRTAQPPPNVRERASLASAPFE